MSGPATMPTRTRVAPAYLGLFLALYAVQGVVYAYFINFNQGYMVAGGVDRATASWVQSLALVPFILKFLAGPLSDRFDPLGLGRRRSYILLGLVLQGLGLAGLALIHPGRHLAGFGAMAVATVLGLALYDTCCDGMVIDVTPPGDRARVQGALMAARFLAATVCSLGFGFWLSRTGVGPGRGEGVLWACAGLGVLPLGLAIAVREPDRAADADRFRWSALGVLLRPRSLALLAFGALYSMVGYGAEINMPSYYETLGFGPGDVGGLGAARNIGRAAGAGLLPLLSPRLGRVRTIGLGLVGLLVATAGHAAIHGLPAAGALGFAFGAANGWADAIFFVLAMEACNPRLAASTYALFMAVSNLSVAGGGLFAATVQLIGRGYRPVFLAWPIAIVFAAIFVPALARPPAPEPTDAPA